MKKILLKGLRSKRQLRECAEGKVVSANYADDTERDFIISFECSDGMRDLVISFETRSPHIYISEACKGGD